MVQKNTRFNTISAVFLVIVTLWSSLVISDNPITWYFGDFSVFCIPLFFLLAVVFSILSVRNHSNRIGYILIVCSTIGLFLSMIALLYIIALASAFKN